MKKITRIFVVALCLCAFTNKATAQFNGGNGTEDNPYIIATPDQLATLATFVNDGNANYVDKCYKLLDNLDLSKYHTGHGWTAIGNGVFNPFKGNFDGNYKKITGLQVLDYSNGGALFGRIERGTIKNLGVEDVYMIGDMGIGAVVGALADHSTMTNCYSTGTISGSFPVGGIVGMIQEGSTMSNCYSLCNTGGQQWVGGVAGVAAWGAIISNCYSAGVVSGNELVGGIVGYINFDNSNISNCVALHQIVKGATAATNVGRVAGINPDNILSNNAAWTGILKNNGSGIWENIGENRIDGADMSTEAIHADGTLGERFIAENGWTIENGKLPGLFGNTVEMPEYLFLQYPPQIITDSLPKGELGTEYYVILAANGDTPMAWSLAEGILPPGLTLFSSGTITGTPETEGVFNFKVKAQNSAGTDTKALAITVETLGVGETHGNASLRVYPNPTNGKLQVTSYELQDTGIEIFDVYGKKISSHHHIITSSHHTIDISHLPAGIYFLKIAGETVKVVKIN